MWTNVCSERSWLCVLPVPLILTTVSLILIYFKNYFKCVYLALKLSGPPTLPFLGNVLLINNNAQLEMLGCKIPEYYKPIVRIWLYFVPVFIIYKPDHLQVLLSSNKYTSKNILYTFLHNFIGNGLITSSGDKWKNHRKLIQPYFNINTLKIQFSAFCKHSKVLADDLNGKSDVNVVSLINTFVLNVLHETVLGETDYESNSSPYRKGQVFMSYRMIKPWLLLDALFKRTKFSRIESKQRGVLQSYTKKILDKRKLKLQNGFPENVMDMLLEISRNNKNFTEEDIIDEACTFMLAGQDSIGAALAFTLYYLALHQDIQDKVIAEQQKIFNNFERQLTLEDVNEMKYLEQCIKEAMRLCPSVPMLTRKIIKDVELDGYVLPAGTNILFSPFITHRIRSIFPNPLKFDPDRFSAENKNKIHPYAYIPFSAGPRNCIGYKLAFIELKTAISFIIRTYKIFLTPGHENLNLIYRVTLKTKGGVWLRLQKR